MLQSDMITMEHGSGGQATGELIGEVFASAFDSEVLNRMEDSAVVPGSGRIAVTTDSFVVTPLVFRGGDIGRLCVCGTVNDLLMRGAVPMYITCGFILEEGLEISLLGQVVKSLAQTAREAGVEVIAGDTKVVEGNGGLYINTTGVGFVPEGVDIAAANAKAGDAILVSGTMGDHHAAILAERLQIQTEIESDCAPLGEMVRGLVEGGIRVRTLRDITRGGLGTVLKELAEASGKCFVLEESAIPVSAAVRDFCGLLGLDPLYMGNEGKLAAVVPAEQAGEALEILRRSPYGSGAAVIGRVEEASENAKAGELLMKTPLGGVRKLTILQGEGLPRIC